MTTNRLLEGFREGRTAIGGWCVTGSSLSAELFTVEGFDYLCADCQHGLMSYDAMVPVLQAVARTGTTPVVRVARNDTGEIGKALDAGAEAVVVPMVNSGQKPRWPRLPAATPPKASGVSARSGRGISSATTRRRSTARWRAW